jgi:hypothetical protein
MFQGFLACEELVCNLQTHKVSNDVVGKKTLKFLVGFGIGLMQGSGYPCLDHHL